MTVLEVSLGLFMRMPANALNALSAKFRCERSNKIILFFIIFFWSSPFYSYITIVGMQAHWLFSSTAKLAVNFENFICNGFEPTILCLKDHSSNYATAAYAGFILWFSSLSENTFWHYCFNFYAKFTSCSIVIK